MDNAHPAVKSAYSILARYYDLQHSAFTLDVPMYLQAARDAAGRASPGQAAASVVEVGCGTGRVLVPLVEAGHFVLGIDESEEMLSLARRRLDGLPRTSCELLLGDATDPEWRGQSWPGRSRPEQFDLAIVALNTFLHNLSRDDQLGMLRAMQAHLRPGGSLIVDLPPNDEMTYQPDKGEFELEVQLVDPATNTPVDKYVASTLFWSTQEQLLHYRFEEHAPDGSVRIETTSFRMRHVFRYEMELLLLQSGFTSWHWYGDYDLSPYGEGSPRMIVFATR